MEEFAATARANGHIVELPALDQMRGFDELDILDYNRERMEQADIVAVLWDQRSVGTLFDFGMAFAMRKPLVLIYMEPKTFPNALRAYELLTDRDTWRYFQISKHNRSPHETE